MRVLLIEDDGATAQSIELMLKSDGFNVYTTDLGEEGVDLGKLYDYDIILLDLNLPDSEELETIASVRQRAPSLPIVVLTGLRDQETRRPTGMGEPGTLPSERGPVAKARHAAGGRLEEAAGRVREIGLRQFGVEAVYDRVLAGQPERTLRIVGPGGTVLRELNSSAGVEPGLTAKATFMRLSCCSCAAAVARSNGSPASRNASNASASITSDHM